MICVNDRRFYSRQIAHFAQRAHVYRRAPYPFGYKGPLEHFAYAPYPQTVLLEVIRKDRQGTTGVECGPSPGECLGKYLKRESLYIYTGARFLLHSD